MNNQQTENRSKRIRSYHDAFVWSCGHCAMMIEARISEGWPDPFTYGLTQKQAGMAARAALAIAKSLRDKSKRMKTRRECHLEARLPKVRP